MTQTNSETKTPSIPQARELLWKLADLNLSTTDLVNLMREVPAFDVFTEAI